MLYSGAICGVVAWEPVSGGFLAYGSIKDKYFTVGREKERLGLEDSI